MATVDGQVLAAVFGGARQRAPAGGGELGVGVLPAGGRGDVIARELGRGLVAVTIERVEDLGAELAGFVEDGGQRVVVEAFIDAVCHELRNIGCGLERKQDVVYWSLVGHGISLRLCCAGDPQQRESFRRAARFELRHTHFLRNASTFGFR